MTPLYWQRLRWNCPIIFSQQLFLTPYIAAPGFEPMSVELHQTGTIEERSTYWATAPRPMSQQNKPNRAKNGKTIEPFWRTKGFLCCAGSAASGGGRRGVSERPSWRPPDRCCRSRGCCSCRRSWATRVEPPGPGRSPHGFGSSSRRMMIQLSIRWMNKSTERWKEFISYSPLWNRRARMSLEFSGFG